MKNNFYLLLLSFLCSLNIYAQTKENTQIKNVYGQLVLSYGSAKPAPELVIIAEKKLQKTPAFYTKTPKPSIKVDAQFYKLCQSFGKDSLNALSIVLSHELAHYYNDHTFCSDFAYAISKTNKNYSGKLKLVSKNDKVNLETQADYKGLFFAAVAGYAPFKVHPQLLDAVYKMYYIKDESDRYPTKAERKEIAQNAIKKAEQLYGNFKLGLKELEEKKYKTAITIFEAINQEFYSRENFNNIGVAKTLQALDLKLVTNEEFHFPKRFLYPLEIDNNSRLNVNATRSNTTENQNEMMSLLTNAQKDFQEAIRLDPTYTKGYVNLACVYDLLDNPNAAIGKIKELPLEQQKELDAQRILAIAYYHNDQEKKAEEIWRLIER
jgi:hypothetical protein